MTTPIYDFSGKVALVTGATGGMGRSIAAALARTGASVMASDVSEHAGSELLAQVDSRNLAFTAADVSDGANVEALVAATVDRFGTLDYAVNAAGIELELSIEETSLEAWNRIMAINVTGTFLTSKYALPLLRASDHASIINFGSYDGYIADPNLAAYCATKGAVHALTKAMACDHGKEGIRVNAICPGYIDTPMLQQFVPAGVDAAAARAEQIAVHPLRTIGTPTDMANLVNWLASDEARYATGQLWVLDGGLSAQVQQMRF